MIIVNIQYDTMLAIISQILQLCKPYYVQIEYYDTVSIDN